MRRGIALAGVMVLVGACGSSQPTSKVLSFEDHSKIEPAADPTTGLEGQLAMIAAAARPVLQRASRSGSRSRLAAGSVDVAMATAMAVSSTAYCETGLMANGQRTYRGAVAMNGQPMGSKWRVVETGGEYVVSDRIGSGSAFDIAMPGDCDGAKRYGRRTVHVERIK